jgi:hypothetical protein
MDPATFAFDTATALTAALALLFSRLDTQRQRTKEHFDLREALWQLTFAVNSWASDAANTDRTIQDWAEGQLDNNQAATKLAFRLTAQGSSSDAALALLHGKNIVDRLALSRLGHPMPMPLPKRLWRRRLLQPPWHDLRHLLNLYGPEVLEVLETAFRRRRVMLSELIDELPTFQSRGPEIMQELTARLQSATSELENALNKLNEYVRIHFPPDP